MRQKWLSLTTRTVKHLEWGQEQNPSYLDLGGCQLHILSHFCSKLKYAARRVVDVDRLCAAIVF